METAFVANCLAIDLNPASIVDECIEEGFLQAVFDGDFLSEEAWLFETYVKRLRIADPLCGGSGHQGRGETNGEAG